MAVVLHDAQLFGPVEVDGGVLGEGVEAQVFGEPVQQLLAQLLAREVRHFLDLTAQILARHTPKWLPVQSLSKS